MNLISVMKLMQSFQWVVFRNNQSSLLVNLLFLKVIFMLISVVLLVQISNSCVSEVATENIYLLSFFALVLIMLRAAYLLYKYFFYILVSLKKELHQESNGIFRININFSY